MKAFAAVIKYYDENTASEKTLYLATTGFVTSPTDTPANQHFAGRLRQPTLMSRSTHHSGRTSGKSTTGKGVLEIENSDGEYDWLLDMGFDGRDATVYYGDIGDAFPASWKVLGTTTMEQAEFTRETVSILLRDNQERLNVPLQATKYLGDGSALEGTAELKGKPKPRTLGFVRNATPVCVDTRKRIYQVNDGSIAALTVYDEGITLKSALIGWTRDASVLGDDIYDLAFGNATFVVVGWGGGGANPDVRTSLDGISWTNRTNPFGLAIYFVGFADYSTGHFILASAGANNVAYSTNNGATWTASTFTSGSIGGPGIEIYGAFGNGVEVLVDNDRKIVRSTDGGATWQAVTNPFSAWPAGSRQNIAFGKGRFVISNGVQAAWSTTGATGTWTVVDISSLGMSGPRALAFGKDIFILGDSNSPTNLAWSQDGVTWQLRTNHGLALDGTLADMTFAGTRFVACDAGRGIYTSVDGLIWLRVTSPLVSSNTPTCVVYGDGVTLIGCSTGVPGTGDIARAQAGVSYASLADLQDDSQAPLPGQVGVYFAGGLFRLGSVPEGEITCDVTQGASAAARTAGQLAVLVMGYAGLTSGDWSASDITTLDSKNSSVLGLYVTQEMTCSAALDALASTVGAWWSADRNGVIRIKRLEAPSGSPVRTFKAVEMVDPLERIRAGDTDHGIPTWRSILRYDRYYTVQGKVAGGVTQDRRSQLGIEWREVTSSNSAVLTKHSLSPQSTDESLFTVQANAQTEVDRRQDLREVRRDPFRFAVAIKDDTVELDLGDVVEVVHDRFGLAQVGSELGALFVVTGVAPDAAQEKLVFTVWGNVHQGLNRVTRDDVYRITKDGKYRITKANA